MDYYGQEDVTEEEWEAMGRAWFEEDAATDLNRDEVWQSEPTPEEIARMIENAGYLPGDLLPF